MSDDERAATHSTEQAELEQLAARLREAREYLGLSQEFVADKLGVPRASISAMETAKRKVSSLELKELARLYKRPVSYLLGEDQERLAADDETAHALFRTASRLTEEDRIQLLRFAEFLRGAGRAPQPSDTKNK